MKRILLSVITLISLLLCVSAMAVKEVALTIDDLPFVGNAKNKVGNLRREKERFMMALEAIRKYQVPAVGFVVAGSIEKDQMQLLHEFMRGGNIIANHTYSHPNLNRTSAERYITNIDKADKRLAPLMGKHKYFRYPFLAEGNTRAKFNKVKEYLKSKNYVIVPVTIDSKDFKFNARLLRTHWRQRKSYLNSMRSRYLSYISAQIARAERKAMKKVNRPIKHILLIHMNYLNAYFMGDVIQLFKNRGYKFITLPDALSDPYYKNQSKKYGTNGSVL